MAAPVDIKKVFDEIATKYHWEDKVRDFMLAREGLRAERIEDFLMAVTDVGQWDAVMAKVKDVGNLLLQTSRVRQAWVGLKDAEETASRLKRKRGEDTDLDELLP